MVGYYNQGVPTTAELENNSNQKKYTVNRTPKGDVVISKPVCAALVLLALLLIALAALLTYFLHPSSCTGVATPEALLKADLRRIAAKLPQSLWPIHYRLQIIPFLEEGNFTTNGAVQIVVKAAKPTNKIELNSNDIDIDEHSLEVKELPDNRTLGITGNSYDNISQIYTISLNETLKEKKQYEVDIKFKGYLNNYMQGFYRSSYEDSSTRKKRWMAVTQFSPTDARRAFPCFDEPQFKANYTISIARPNNLTSLSNMPKRESLRMVDREDWIWDHFKETPKMSSYLVAFVVSDLQSFRYNSSEKLFTIWCRRDAIDQTRLAMDLGPRILQFYEKYFGIGFPLPKIDMVAVPDFGFNAMENWGLITFRESELLFDEKVSTINDKREIASVIAHELAHQWFGNLITPEWWDDLWLKEGFSNYMKYLGINYVEPSWNIQEEFLIYEVHKAFRSDCLKSSHPLTVQVFHTDDIRAMFDIITYSKGASILRMMKHFLGEQTFKAAIIQYLKIYSYSNAKKDDLWNVFTNQTEIDGILKANVTIKEIMDTWTVRPGFPVVTAVRDKSTNEITVSQTRFLYDRTHKDDTIWWIPLSITTDLHYYEDKFNDSSPKQWLNTAKKSFPIDADKWWLLNLHQTGYYIVNYDEQNWKALIENIINFPHTIQSQLISDSMELARAGLLDYDIPLKIIKEIAVRDKIITFLPLHTSFSKIEYLYNMLTDTPAFGDFEIFLSTVYSYAFYNVHFDDKTTDTYLVQRIRRLVLKWACQLSDPRCVADARHLYRNWMTTPNNPQGIRPNIREVIFCTALREGSEPEWNFAYKQYLKSQSTSEKESILNALGCASKPWLLSRYLDYLLKSTSGIRKQDGPRVFRSVASNILGRRIAFNFLKSNWEQINEYYGSGFNSVRKMIDDVTTYMNTEGDLEELMKFKKENWNSLGTSEQVIDATIEKVKNNINWMKYNYRPIEKWLVDHNEHFGLRN